MGTAIALGGALPLKAETGAVGHDAEDSQIDTNSSKRPQHHTLEKVIVTAVPLGQAAADVVTPVSVLSGDALNDAKAPSLGETVSTLAGVQTTSLGQAVGRPVIRGLDGARVAVLAGGLDAGDVSDISQDHAVSIEPFLADQIEVLKGPSTLLYGSGAIGGVVNVVDGRVPTASPQNGVTGRAEARYDSVSDGRTGMFRLDAGDDRFTLHADGLRRDTDDYDIPGGKLRNSALDTTAGAVGGSLHGDWGYLGGAVSRFMDTYGSPAEPGDPQEGEPPISIKLAKTRYELKGGLYTIPGIEKAELSAAHTQYQHVEYEGDEVGTTFKTHSNEARALFTHVPLAGWHGAFGVQASRRQFSAVGEETFVPATRTRAYGLFLTEQRRFGPLKLELGARSDYQSATPEFGQARRFHPHSGSLGLGWEISGPWSTTLNLSHAERAPAEEELFSNGPHEASATFEIGSPNLDKESSNQAELGLHLHGERVDAKVAAYYNRYNGFIYLADTGEVEDDLPVRVWSQRDASFHGAEAEATFHLARSDAGDYDLRMYGDTVRASFKDGGGNLPRMPAGRLGSQFIWSLGDWRANLGVVHYFRQDKVARYQTAEGVAYETDTAGFTLVDAHANWTFHQGARSRWEAFLDGRNLTNRTARLATSLFKDVAPMPGRNVSVGVRAYF